MQYVCVDAVPGGMCWGMGMQAGPAWFGGSVVGWVEGVAVARQVAGQYAHAGCFA